MEFHTIPPSPESNRCVESPESNLVPDLTQRLGSSAAGAGAGAIPISTPFQTQIQAPVCLHFASVISDKERQWDRELDSRCTRIVWGGIGDTSSRGSTGSHSHPLNSPPTVGAQNTSLLSAGSGEDRRHINSGRMDPEGDASRPPGEESLSLYKEEQYDSTADFETASSTFYQKEVGKERVGQASEEPVLPPHLASIEQAKVGRGDSETTWEGNEKDESDESGEEDGSDEKGGSDENDESDEEKDDSDESDEEEDEGDEEKDESDEEEDEGDEEVDKAGDTASGKETAADTREEGDTQKQDLEVLTSATTSVRALALRTIRQNDEDLGEVDLSEILSPEEIEFVKKRGEGRATEAETGHTEGSSRPGGQFHETETQASVAQSDSTSPYNSEEITRLSALPEKPDTRFMHVWNMFDTEKTGKLKVSIFMQFLERYEEFCWDSNEPLFSKEDLQNGQMFSSDPGYGKLEMSMKEARDATKLFAAKARFQGVMKNFEYENTEAIQIKDLPEFLIALQEIMKEDIFSKELQKEIEQYSKHLDLQDKVISAMEVKDLFTTLGQPILEQLARSVQYDDHIYDEKAASEVQEVEEPKTLERREPRDVPATPVGQDYRGRPLAPARVEKAYRKMQSTPRTPSPKRHGLSLDSPDFFLGTPPLAYSTPLKGNHRLPWSSAGQSSQGNSHEDSPLGAIRALAHERDQLRQKVSDLEEGFEEQVASAIDISLSHIKQERVQRSDLSAEEKDNLRHQVDEANYKVRGLEKKLQRMEWDLEEANNYAVEVKNALDKVQAIRTNIHKSNNKLRAEAESAADMYTRSKSNQVALEAKIKEMEFNGAIKDYTLNRTQAHAQMLDEVLVMAEGLKATIDEQAREIEDLKAKYDGLNEEQSLLETTYIGAGRSQRKVSDSKTKKGGAVISGPVVDLEALGENLGIANTDVAQALEGIDQLTKDLSAKEDEIEEEEEEEEEEGYEEEEEEEEEEKEEKEEEERKGLELMGITEGLKGKVEKVVVLHKDEVGELQKKVKYLEESVKVGNDEGAKIKDLDDKNKGRKNKKKQWELVRELKEKNIVLEKDLEGLKKEIADKTAEAEKKAKSLDEEIQKERKEGLKADERVKELEGAKAALEKLNKELEAEKDNMVRVGEKLRKELREEEEKVRKAEERRKGLEDELKQLDGEKARAEKAKKDLEASRQMVMVVKKELADKIEVEKKAAAESEERLKELEASRVIVEQLEKEVVMKNAELEKLMGELLISSTKVHYLVKSSDEAKMHLRESFDKEKEELQRGWKKLEEELNAGQTLLEISTKLLSEELDSTLDSLDMSKAEVKELELVVQKLTEQLQEKQRMVVANRLKAKDQEISGLKKDIDNWVITDMGSQGKISKLGYELSAKDIATKKLNKDLAEYSVKLADTQKKLTDTGNELSNAQTELKETQTELEETQTELREVQTELDETQAELEETQTGLKKAQMELNEAQTRLEKTQTELDEAQMGLKETQTGLEKTQTELNEAQMGLKETQTGLEKTQTELKEAQMGLKETQAELKGLKEENAELIRQVTDINQLITELRGNTRHLQSTITRQQMTITEQLNTNTQLRSTTNELQDTTTQQKETLSLVRGDKPRRKLDLKGVQRDAIVRALKDLTPEELERLDPKLWPATPYENITVWEFMFWPILELMRFTIWKVPFLLSWWERKAKESGMEDWEIYEPEWEIAGRPAVRQGGIWIRGGATPSLPGTPVEEVVSGGEGDAAGFEASDLLAPSEVDLSKYFASTDTKSRRYLVYSYISPHKKCSSPHAWLRAVIWVLMFLLLLGSLLQQWAIVAETEEIKQQWAKPNTVVVRDWLADRRPRTAGWCEDGVCYCQEWWWVRIVREWILEWLGLDREFD